MPAGNLCKMHQRSFHSWTKFYQPRRFSSNRTIYELTNVQTMLDEKLKEKENTNILWKNFGFCRKSRKTDAILHRAHKKHQSQKGSKKSKQKNVG